MLPSRETVLILSGERGAGKTTACREAARLARDRGLSVGGVLCPSRRDAAGLPVEIEAESLTTSERRLLASRERELGGPRWPPSDSLRSGMRPFSFSDECFAWALGLLRFEAEAGTSFLLLDEIGPVELVLGRGFRPFLDSLASNARSVLFLATARTELAAKLVALPAFRDARRLDLEVSTRSSVPVEIALAAVRSLEKNAL